MDSVEKIAKTVDDAIDEALKALSGYAEEKKVFIGVENVWNKFLLSPLEMAAFIDETGSNYVKAYFDAGNVLQFAYPQHWVEVLGKRIAKIHIKDFDGGIGNITGFKPLLQGDMPWAALMAALKAVHYDGYVTAELGAYRTHPSQLIRDTSAAMDYILSL
jgi:hexulose-6-phosphate isomerase